MPSSLQARRSSSSSERLGCVAVRVVARVQTDLVTSSVDPPHESSDRRIVDRVRAVDLAGGMPGDEVERAREATPLARRHDEVEGVAEIAACAPPLVRARRRRAGRGREPDRAAQSCRRRKREAPAQRSCCAARPVDVVADQHAAGPRSPFESWPQSREQTPKDVEVFVDDRSTEKPFLRGERGAGPEALVLVPLAYGDLLVPGQHEEGTAEEVESESRLPRADIEVTPARQRVTEENRERLRRRRRA